MGQAGVLQGVRQMRFEGLLERHERGELSGKGGASAPHRPGAWPHEHPEIGRNGRIPCGMGRSVTTTYRGDFTVDLLQIQPCAIVYNLSIAVDGDQGRSFRVT